MSEKKVNVLKKQGIVLGKAGKFNEALAVFKEALKIQPENWAITNNIAKTLFDCGRVDEALPFAKKAANKKPTDLRPLQTLLCIFSTRENWEDVLRTIEKIVQIMGWTNQLRQSQSAALFNLNRFNEALDFINNSGDLEGSMKAIKAASLLGLGRFNEISESLKEIVQDDSQPVHYRVISDAGLRFLAADSIESGKEVVREVISDERLPGNMRQAAIAFLKGMEGL